MQRPAGFRGDFRTDDVARGLYSEGAGIYRIVPAGVAAPADLDDLVALVRWASAEGVGLVPRGAGSGMGGHNVGTGLVVDLTCGFRAAPAIDPDARTATAGAAVTYRELNGAAAGYGLRLPPDPSSGCFCTIGGMVSTNAAGARSLRHGSIRRWVRGLGFVTAEGEVGRTGADRPTAAERRFRRDVAPAIEAAWEALAARVPRTTKNSSGYDLLPPPGGDWVRNLLVGSEGTLGIVTEVEVALAPLPGATETLLVTLASLDDVAAVTGRLDAFQPEAIELLDRTYLDLVRAAAHAPIPPGTEAVLLVEIEGSAEEAAASVRSRATSVVRAEDAETAARLWETRHLASPVLAGLPDHLRSLQVVEDGCVPRQRLGEYVTGLRRSAAAHRFGIVIFGHAGDGHVHANLLADVSEPDFTDRLLDCLDQVSRLQIGLGGTLTGEHGDGRLRAPYLRLLYGEPHATLSRDVKRAFDPEGILNPGVKLGSGPAFDASLLKVGPGSPELPGEVAEVLRGIERDAAWGADRLDLAHALQPASTL